jgi:hypothetical protein
VKCFVFWDIMPCSLLKVGGRFGGNKHDPVKRLSTFNGQLDVTSQKIELFITNAVRTSHCTGFDLCVIAHSHF